MATQWQICAAQSTAEAEVWHDCADLGISGVRRIRQGDGMDTLTFKVESGTALTDDQIFAHKAYVRFRKVVDTVPELYFFGRVLTVPRDGPAVELEAQTYTVGGPGEQLLAVTYRQDWTEQSGVVCKPRVVLFQASDGSRCTTGAQIYDAVSWARTCGVRIAEPSALNIITGVALPYDERVNIKCLDVITECLRWHPHVVVWWDYTQREPVFHCALRDTLTAVSVPETSAGGITVSERKDIQVPAVAICYEKSIQVDDNSWKQTVIDVAPVIEGETESEKAARLNQLDVVWATYDLDGSTQTNATQKVVTEEFPSDYLNLAWWKARETWLQEYADAHITLSNGRRMNDTDLPRILVEGTMQTWMNKDVASERICVDAEITRYENGAVVLVEKRPISRTVVATNASSKTYKTIQAYDSGETIPTGVAASLYAEWSGLHCEGSFFLEESECSGVYAPGKALNVTGGRDAWASMLAMIWRTVEDIDSGTTTVEFGPVKTVDADSLVALFRATRNRRYSYSRTFRNGAMESTDPGTGSADPAANSTYSGLPLTKRLCVTNNVSGSETEFHRVDINPAAISPDGGTTPEAAAQVLSIQPIELMQNDGPDANGNARVAVFKAYAIVTAPAFDRYESLSNITGGSSGPVTADNLTVQEPLAWDTTDPTILLLKLAAQSGLTVLYNGSTLVGLAADVRSHSGLKINTSSPSLGLQLEGLTPGTAPTAPFVWGYISAGLGYGKFELVTLTF